MSGTLAGVLRESRRLGFLGPGPVDEHLQRSLAFADAISEPPDRAIDLGAGGGLPGLVLAVERWPATIWCLLDAAKRRTDFLREVVEDLGLEGRVTVVHGRAEEHGRAVGERGCYDLVVARSFGPPAVVAECAAPLLRTGGHLVVSEPPDTPLEDRWPVDGLSTLGLRNPTSVVGGTEMRTHLARMDRSDSELDRYPRRVGIPAKRPLF